VEDILAQQHFGMVLHSAIARLEDIHTVAVHSVIALSVDIPLIMVDFVDIRSSLILSSPIVVEPILETGIHQQDWTAVDICAVNNQAARMVHRYIRQPNILAADNPGEGK
jgi:hypothetical protein